MLTASRILCEIDVGFTYLEEVMAMLACAGILKLLDISGIFFIPTTVPVDCESTMFGCRLKSGEILIDVCELPALPIKPGERAAPTLVGVRWTMSLLLVYGPLRGRRTPVCWGLMEMCTLGLRLMVGPPP